MFTKKIFALLVFTLVVFISAASEIKAQGTKPLPEGSSSFESVNYSTQHMSYDNNQEGIIETQNNQDAKRRSAFTIKKGPYGYTFEALYQPGSYLYFDSDKFVYLKRLTTNPPDWQKKRMSFTSEQGKAKSGDAYFTFRSAESPDLFLRHCGMRLVVHSAKADDDTLGCDTDEKVSTDDITWKIAEPYTAVTNVTPDNNRYSFRSVNYKDMYIHHNQEVGNITQALSSTRVDATFKIVKGLTGEANTVSFEAIDKPGYFLRHESTRIKLHQMPAADELFKKDATFKIIPGNSGEGKSLESVNFPGYYIRHCGFQLWLDNNKMNNKYCSLEQNVYLQDTSYIILEGLAQ